MNALPSVAATARSNSQATPPTSGAPRAGASSLASTTFAGVLQDAAAKPVRKTLPSKPDVSDSGASLPGSGNPPPLTAPPAATVLPFDATAPTSANLAGDVAFTGAAAPAGQSPTPLSESTAGRPAAQSGATIDSRDGLPVGLSEPTFGLQAAGTPVVASGDVAAAAQDAASQGAASQDTTAGLVSGAALDASPARIATATTAESEVGSSNAVKPPVAQGVRTASASVGANGGDEAADDTGGGGAASSAGTGAAVGVAATVGTAVDVAKTAGATVGVAATAGAAAPLQTPDPAAAVRAVGAPAGLTPLSGSAPGIGGAASVTSLASALTAARAAVGASDADASSVIGAAGNEYRHARGDADASSSNGGGGADAAAGLSQLNSTAAGNGAAPPTFRVSANVASSDFSQELADRVSYMASNDLNGAKLQVTPAQLGPIELRISVTGDHAQVWMSTHSAVTRDALESSAPKLREMLGAQGFGQVSVDISQRSFQDRSGYAQPYEAPVSEGSASAASALPVSGTSRVSAGTLDAYA
jgi:flagellar hook-length control protein FliK